MIFIDAETGLTIRPMDLDRKEDLKLFIKANENIVNELKKLPDFPTTDPYQANFWSVYSEIGHGMHIEHLNPREKGYVFIRDEKPIGTGWVSEFVVGLGRWEPPRTKPDYCYPVIDGFELKTPWSKLSADMHYALGRMLKERGFDPIYVFLFVNHPIYTYLSVKRQIGFLGNFMAVWELSL